MGGDGLNQYRIFSNDRGKVGGVPMYSCLTQMLAASAAGAEMKANLRYRTFGPPKFAALKAIEWPPSSQESKDWFEKHVGALNHPSLKF